MILKGSTKDCTKLFRLEWAAKQGFSSLRHLSLTILFFFLGFAHHAQIDFQDFKREIDKLKKDRKIEKYWRELYKEDRDNARLKVPMDSMFLLNRLKTTYLIQKYGFPSPDRFGKRSHITFLSILQNNCFSDLNTLTFSQAKKAHELGLWGSRYPNSLMVNELFWYNGIEIALDQEFALALRRLESKSMDSVSMVFLCAKASELLKMLHSADTRVVGEWTMHYRGLEIPLQILRYRERFYLKKGKYFFELKTTEGKVFRFAQELDGTSLLIFENGELVLRDMYQREMGIYPVKNTTP